ncbi:MAG: nuclear transport factor 2 family protein [Planctomycetia bacterium]|nr:nuclear transport factor 2 family protein [Planctomycetia bacterium]
MHVVSPRLQRFLLVVASVAMSAGVVARAEATAQSAVVDGVKKASAAYAEAFNKGDFAALADQWTTRAELVEGGATLFGRDTIVESIKAWRGRHPQSTLEIEVRDVEVIAEPLARVAGVMRFRQKAGDKPLESRFTGLRVREGDTWRIAESRVIPAHKTALDELEWILGTWQAEVADRATIELTYEKALGDYAIVGRVKITPKPGKALLLPNGIEALEVIHADRDAGLIRSWIFDSTGARAEGFFEWDGTSFEKVMTGTPADAVRGRVAKWVQVISPAGEGRVTTHMIERSIDDVEVPDAAPLNFKKIR